MAVKTSFFYSIFLVSGFVCYCYYCYLPTFVVSPLILYPTTLAGYFLSTWVVCLGYYLTYALLLCHTGPRECLLTVSLPTSVFPVDACFAYQWTTRYGPPHSLGPYQLGLHSPAMGTPPSNILL